MAVLPDPASRIVAWQRRAGRQALPWQARADAYAIWVAEIMLQQTQAGTASAYYTRFLARFPDVRALADAPLDAVLQSWAGLGYYARARNLHACAQAVCTHHGGEFPRTVAALAQLPGIGRSTAAAIAACAWGVRAPILDGNVRRILARHAGIEGAPERAATRHALWAQAEAWLAAAPADLDMRTYTQGQMDLGALVCTPKNPDCAHCPLADDCVARRTGRQNALPTPRARRERPRQTLQLLLACCGPHLLLQRRAPRGVWGGLWSLPQFDRREALDAACRTLDAAPQRPVKMAAVPHELTHRRLLLQPWRLVVARPSPPATPLGRWVARDQLPELGLPTPIAALISAAWAPDPPRSP